MLSLWLLILFILLLGLRAVGPKIIIKRTRYLANNIFIPFPFHARLTELMTQLP